MEHITIIALLEGAAWKVLTPCATFYVYLAGEGYDLCADNGDLLRKVDSLSDVRYAVFNFMAESKA